MDGRILDVGERSKRVAGSGAGACDGRKDSGGDEGEEGERKAHGRVYGG